MQKLSIKIVNILLYFEQSILPYNIIIDLWKRLIFLEVIVLSVCNLMHKWPFLIFRIVYRAEHMCCQFTSGSA